MTIASISPNPTCPKLNDLDIRWPDGSFTRGVGLSAAQIRFLNLCQPTEAKAILESPEAVDIAWPKGA